MAEDGQGLSCVLQVHKVNGSVGGRYTIDNTRRWALIGSHQDCDIRIQSDDVARYSALVKHEEAQVKIYSLDSSFPLVIPKTETVLLDKQNDVLYDQDVFFVGKRFFTVQLVNARGVEEERNTHSVEDSEPAPVASKTSRSSAREKGSSATAKPSQKKRTRRTSLLVTDLEEKVVIAPVSTILPKDRNSLKAEEVPAKLAANLPKPGDSRRASQVQGVSVGSMKINLSYGPEKEDSVLSLPDPAVAGTNPVLANTTVANVPLVNAENSRKDGSLWNPSGLQEIASQISTVTNTVASAASEGQGSDPAPYAKKSRDRAQEAANDPLRNSRARAAEETQSLPVEKNDKQAKYRRLMEGLSATPLKRKGLLSVRNESATVRTAVSDAKPKLARGPNKENVFPTLSKQDTIHSALSPSATPFGMSAQLQKAPTTSHRQHRPFAASKDQEPVAQAETPEKGASRSWSRLSTSPGRREVNFASTELPAGSHYSPFRVRGRESGKGFDSVAKETSVLKRDALPRPSPSSGKQRRDAVTSKDHVEGPPPNPRLAILGTFLYRAEDKTDHPQWAEALEAVDTEAPTTSEEATEPEETEESDAIEQDAKEAVDAEDPTESEEATGSEDVTVSEEATESDTGEQSGVEGVEPDLRPRKSLNSGLSNLWRRLSGSFRNAQAGKDIGSSTESMEKETDAERSNIHRARSSEELPTIEQVFDDLPANEKALEGLPSMEQALEELPDIEQVLQFSDSEESSTEGSEERLEFGQDLQSPDSEESQTVQQFIGHADDDDVLPFAPPVPEEGIASEDVPSEDIPSDSQAGTSSDLSGSEGSSDLRDGSQASLAESEGSSINHSNQQSGRSSQRSRRLSIRDTVFSAARVVTEQYLPALPAFVSALNRSISDSDSASDTDEEMDHDASNYTGSGGDESIDRQDAHLGELASVAPSFEPPEETAEGGIAASGGRTPQGEKPQSNENEEEGIERKDPEEGHHEEQGKQDDDEESEGDPVEVEDAWSEQKPIKLFCDCEDRNDLPVAMNVAVADPSSSKNVHFEETAELMAAYISSRNLRAEGLFVPDLVGTAMKLASGQAVSPNFAQANAPREPLLESVMTRTEPIVEPWLVWVNNGCTRSEVKHVLERLELPIFGSKEELIITLTDYLMSFDGEVPDGIDELANGQLKTILRGVGLSTAGSTESLRKRLVEHLRTGAKPSRPDQAVVQHGHSVDVNPPEIEPSSSPIVPAPEESGANRSKYECLTVAKLRVVAGHAGVKGVSKLRKKELIDLLIANNVDPNDYGCGGNQNVSSRQATPRAMRYATRRTSKVEPSSGQIVAAQPEPVDAPLVDGGRTPTTKPSKVHTPLDIRRSTRKSPASFKVLAGGTGIATRRKRPSNTGPSEEGIAPEIEPKSPGVSKPLVSSLREMEAQGKRPKDIAGPSKGIAGPSRMGSAPDADLEVEMRAPRATRSGPALVATKRKDGQGKQPKPDVQSGPSKGASAADTEVKATRTTRSRSAAVSSRKRNTERKQSKSQAGPSKGTTGADVVVKSTRTTRSGSASVSSVEEAHGKGPKAKASQSRGTGIEKRTTRSTRSADSR